MAVVQVGDMRMQMCSPYMHMPVRMFAAVDCQSTCVFVVVMTIIMTMKVDVFHHLMLMLMFVFVVHEEPECHRKQCEGKPLFRRDAFVQKECRQRQSHEWAAGEEHLRTSSTESLRRDQKEHKTQTVSGTADGDTDCGRLHAPGEWGQTEPDRQVDGACCEPFPERHLSRRSRVYQR